jgi:riboflavin transporter FmnP
MTLLVPLLELPTSETGVYGLIMNILSSTTFVVVASVIYKFKKTLLGAILALCAAALSMTAVMMLANLFITPYYMGVEQTMVVGLIPTLLLPFNAVKAVLNAALTLCLYKPVTRVLKKSGFTRGGASEYVAAERAGSLRSVLVLVISGAIAVAALLVIFLVLGGKIAIY